MVYSEMDWLGHWFVWKRDGDMTLREIVLYSLLVLMDH